MRIHWAFWLIAGALVAANVAIFACFPPGSGVVSWSSSALPVVCGAIAVHGLRQAVRRYRTRDRARAAWLLLAIGVGLSALAELVYCVLDKALGLRVAEAGRSLADVFWILSYPPCFAGLAMSIDGYRRGGFGLANLRWRIAAATASIALAATAAAVWVMVPIWRDAQTGALGKLVYSYYPLADCVLLAPAALLVAMTLQFGRSTFSLPWRLIALGFVCWCASDLVFSVLSWQGRYGDGNFIDLGWNASYLLIGAAGLYQKALLELR